MGERTIDDLRQLQALPLWIKIKHTERRIRDWVNYYGEDGVYISFSGGKDSTVLLDIVRKLYPNIEVVYADTGLEYPEIKAFVKSFNNVTIVRPKMSFKQVIETYGYPVASKETAKTIYDAKRGGKLALEKANRTLKDANGNPSPYILAKRWQPLMDAPFNVSHKCCDIIKKKPLKAIKKRAILATMAEESKLRTLKWLQNGCNAFDTKDPISSPMSFWTEQDVLQYIKENNLPICSVYGEIMENENGNLTTTKAKRTGCVFCMFGVHLEKEPNRFQLLKQAHPKLWEYCLKPTDLGGLGMKEVLDYIGVKYE